MASWKGNYRAIVVSWKQLSDEGEVTYTKGLVGLLATFAAVEAIKTSVWIIWAA